MREISDKFDWPMFPRLSDEQMAEAVNKAITPAASANMKILIAGALKWIRFDSLNSGGETLAEFLDGTGRLTLVDMHQTRRISTDEFRALEKELDGMVMAFSGRRLSAPTLSQDRAERVFEKHGLRTKRITSRYGGGYRLTEGRFGRFQTVQIYLSRSTEYEYWQCQIVVRDTTGSQPDDIMYHVVKSVRNAVDLNAAICEAKKKVHALVKSEMMRNKRAIRRPKKRR